MAVVGHFPVVVTVYYVIVNDTPRFSFFAFSFYDESLRLAEDHHNYSSITISGCVRPPYLVIPVILLNLIRSLLCVAFTVRLFLLSTCALMLKGHPEVFVSTEL